MIDIISKGEYPSRELSNFAKHAFVFDGTRIRSMEGFLQSLKYKNEKIQKKICLLSGKDAKKSGKYKIRWRLTHVVYWKSERYHLFSDELQVLIDRVYEAMYDQNPEFRRALLDTGEQELVHSIGKNRIDKTILTQYHYVRRLERLRQRAKMEEYTKNNKGPFN